MNEKTSFDQLTATYTRSAFLALVDKFLKIHSRQGMLLVDIDDLKFINRNKTKAIGDVIITLIVRNIYNHVPKNAIIGRLSEDAFAIFFPDLKSAQKLGQAAQDLVLIHRKPIVYRCENYIRTISIGGVQTDWLNPDDLNAESLLHYAEMALDMAKQNGKNQYIELNQIHLHAINRKAHVLNLLKETLDQKAFQLNFQPFFNMQTGDLIGFEALCRLNDSDGAGIGPTEFIKIAEENNIIYDIDLFVLEYVCQILSRWADNSFKSIITVNVSPISFMNPDFIYNLQEIISRYQIHLGNLAIELTETAFIESFARAKEVIGALNQLGIKVLLDDFGVGYSNLQSVLELNVDMLKIDKSLIDNIHEMKSHVIVKKTLEIAELFNMDVVVEGVETRMQFETLKQMNIKAGQGFYLGRPIPAEELIPYLRAKP